MKKFLLLVCAICSLNAFADTFEEIQAKNYAENLKIQIVKFCQEQNLDTNSDMRACIRETMDEVIARMVHEQKEKSLELHPPRPE